MRKEILIRVQPDHDNGRHNKALKAAASVSGVKSVTVTGRDRDLLVVIGDGVDEAKLARKLSKEAGGQAEIVELRTLPSGGADPLPPVASMEMVAALSSPYHRHHPTTPGGSLPLPGGGELMSSQAGYSYPRCTPSPGHYCYHPSPAAGPGVHQGQPAGGYGYGGSGGNAARAVARGHPANYSPMIARHDERRVGCGRRRAGKPSCCTIL
ncbi:unnamed protein product [Urochloa decumbens]|uniref:Uncharacterized protein n=1 Tax=Urochloa decumbens TaxID=240449 RepID=A0ABC9D5N2_9POAL